MTIVEKRVRFTRMVAALFDIAFSYNFSIIIDYVLRSAAEQERLFRKGLSKCDGKKKKSDHQRALAVDLYIIEDGKISNDKEKYELLHKHWERLGGRKMLSWDLGHFGVE